MSFKRHVSVNKESTGSIPSNTTRTVSAVTSRSTVATGTPSLDALLFGGYTGLPLGTCLLIEEEGVTDFSSIIIRCAASQGVLSENAVLAIGVDESWPANCPGPGTERKSTETREVGAGETNDEMKIAWRYRHCMINTFFFCLIYYYYYYYYYFIMFLFMNR